MPEAGTWTSEKRPLKKRSMQRQRRCSNLLLAPTRWTQVASKNTDPRRRKRRTPEKISPPTPFLLTHLVRNSHLLLSRLPPLTRRRTKTTNEVPAAIKDRDKVVAATSLQQVLTPTPSKERRKTSPKSSASPIIGRDIT